MHEYQRKPRQNIKCTRNKQHTWSSSVSVLRAVVHVVQGRTDYRLSHRGTAGQLQIKYVFGKMVGCMPFRKFPICQTYNAIHFNRLGVVIPL